MKPGGKLYLQTDCLPYWQYLQAVMPCWMEWQVQEGPWPEDPHGRSRRERIAQEKGLRVYRGWGTRRDDGSLEQLQDVLDRMPRPDFRY
jgi:tRNA (guanine-N7-)-methyltransferase